MIDILDVDEATVSSEIRLAQMQAEFEALFNGPLIEMEMMAAAQQQMNNEQFQMTNAGGQDGEDWRG